MMVLMALITTFMTTPILIAMKVDSTVPKCLSFPGRLHREGIGSCWA